MQGFGQGLWRQRVDRLRATVAAWGVVLIFPIDYLNACVEGLELLDLPA